MYFRIFEFRGLKIGKYPDFKHFNLESILIWRVTVKLIRITISKSWKRNVKLQKIWNLEKEKREKF